MTAAEARTNAHAVRLQIELGRSMRNREDAVALRILDRIEQEAERAAERERFARAMARSEFADARRKRA